MPGRTLERIQKIRVDALYGKKKHFNAADRKRAYQSGVSVAVILANTVLGSALFLYAKEAVPTEMKWSGGFLALGTAALAALQSYFSWPKMVQGHCTAAGQYLSLVKQCSNILAQHADGIFSDVQLGQHLVRLTNELSKVDEAANSFPTTEDDYRIAQQGVTGGEEDYTDRELKTGD